MEDAIAKARTEALKSLEKVMEAETKKGNLDGALSIRKKCEEIQKALEDGKDLLGNPIDDQQSKFLDLGMLPGPMGATPLGFLLQTIKLLDLDMQAYGS